MAYSAFIEIFDRLSVKSIFRGSTATWCGILGTFAVFILCLAIYIPPTVAYNKGNYFETQFYTQEIVKQNFYSDDDFKIAVVFRHKVNSSVANHSDILRFAYSTAAELSADQQDYYQENMLECDQNYFSEAINPVVLEDCFIYPRQVKFNLFYSYGAYSMLFYFLYPHYDSNPFVGRQGGPLSSYQSQLENLLANYYYEILFTSKIIDGTGKSVFEVNRFFSTESEPSSLIGVSWNQIIFNVKKTNMDISIMPWINNVTQSNLVWLGGIYTGYQLNPTQSAIYGVEVVFSEYIYQISSFRYYKKLDWLAGIIGGAMLLFYIILWVPCNYINKTLHKIRNTQALLLIDLSKEEQQTDEIDLFPAKVTWIYWLSNFFTNCISQKVRKESQLVEEAERQLDIINLIKKLKVVERTFIKKNINTKFNSKILKIFEKPERNGNIEIGEASNMDIDLQTDQNSIMNAQENQIYEGELVLVEIPTDSTFNFTISQDNFLKNNQEVAKQLYLNNETILTLLHENTGHLKDIRHKSKWTAKPENSPTKIKCLSRLFYGICDLIQNFDFFGARPNLIAQPYNSSCVGCFGVIIIITLTILTVALTISNINVPQMMILNDNLEGKDFNYTLTSGQSLKMAACFSRASSLKGSSRLANLRFFAQSKSRGRQYFNAVPLTSQDYSLFDLTSSTSPIPLQYCFTIDPNHKIMMGKTQNDYGYFGFRVDPYCTSTPSYCTSTSSSTVNSFLTFINSTYVFPLLPENRFDPATKKFINNLVFQPVNINNRFMTNESAMEETIFVDKVEIQDDTKNFFMRKQYEVSYQGIAINANSPYTIAKNIPGRDIYYEIKIRPSINQVNYLVTTPKSDILLGIIGGVFVIWYAILHWMGKLYNSYNPRAKLADILYEEQVYDQYPFYKILTFIPIPLCLIPSCFGIKRSINKMRIIDQKIRNDLHYMSLVKYVDNVFKLSSALFGIDQRKNEFVYEEKNLSLVFVKEKIDESAQVKPDISELQEQDHDDADFLEIQEEIYEDEKMKKNTKNRVTNSSIGQKRKKKKGEEERELSQKEKVQKFDFISGPNEELNQNRINGHPQQFPVSWLDSFEYTASLTYKGKREVTSCCGGCCCLILLMFIAIIASFQVGIYLNRSDTRVGMTTAMMQPLAKQSNSTYNSKLHLMTGTNFKLAVTFSTQFNDYPHDIANYTSIIGISVFQKTFVKTNGTIQTKIQEYPLISCQSDYLTSWLSPIVDSSYYDHTELGYCIADGILLEIDGLPQDQITKSFTVSIFSKNGSSQSNIIVQQFLKKYLPKYHFSNPSKNFETKTITYDISTLVFDPMNITAPVQQNLTLSKMLIKYDNQIAFQGDPFTQQTYSYNPFRQFETAYYGSLSQKMYYNLTFDNSHLVQIYEIQGDKFYETWGIIGGLIAFFIFGFGVIARSFNNYRMKYLIGKELYLFDMLKIKEAKRKARQNEKKSTQQARQMNKINNLSEGHLVAAYFLSFFGGIMRNYNWADVLRRVTIIQQKVEKDLSLFEVYKKVHLMRDQLNKYFKDTHNVDIKLTDLYPKHIYSPSPEYFELQDVGKSKLKSFARKHGWSAYQQRSIFEALQVHVNLRNVFDNDFLEKSFDVFASENSVRLSQYEGTIASRSVGTNSMADRYELAREREQD